MKLFFYIIFFSLFFFQASSKDLVVKGNLKLSLSDIQQLTSIDLDKNNFTSDDLDTIIKDLFISDLIYNVTFEENDESYVILIS